MGRISLVGVDQAGAVITGPGATKWSWDDNPISLLGDGVAGHGEPPHNGPTIATASPWMTIDGVQVTRVGSVATCGHGASGTPPVDIP